MEENIKLLELIEDSDITTMLELYSNINKQIKQLEEVKDALKNKVKTFLKIRKWDRYQDAKTKISIVLSKQSRETIDKKELKNILTEGQYATVVHITSFEKLSFVTPEIRERLKKYVHKKKDKKN